MMAVTKLRRMIFIIVVLLVVCLITGLITSIYALTSEGYQNVVPSKQGKGLESVKSAYIDSTLRTVLTVTGTRSTTTNLVHNSAVGQVFVGKGRSQKFVVNSGFLTAPARNGRSCCLLPGDADNNGIVNILDYTFIQNYLYKGGVAPFCPASADVNSSCTITIIDMTYLLNYLYKGGAPPTCGCA